MTSKDYKVQKTEAEWQEILTPEQYHVLREKGTERPGTGALLHNKEEGTYSCAACGTELFQSETKFDSGCGWPSFYAGNEDAIDEHRDTSHGMIRTEVTCSNCGSHLGHVFPDGYGTPTGMRYCINSLSIGFKKSE